MKEDYYYMEEIYRWIKDNCHVLSGGCFYVNDFGLSEKEKDILGILFSDKDVVEDYYPRQVGVTSCYIWYILYMMTHFKEDCRIGIVVPYLNFGYHVFKRLKREVDMIVGVNCEVNNGKRICVRNGNGNCLEVEVVNLASKDSWLGKSYDVLLCDGFLEKIISYDNDFYACMDCKLFNLMTIG